MAAMFFYDNRIIPPTDQMGIRIFTISRSISLFEPLVDYGSIHQRYPCHDAFMTVLINEMADIFLLEMVFIPIAH
ncbi:MAG: hypothetical protein NC428_10785 [Clostridium sp.]|nr:hypothetical protein [Clostridium sp.]